jgi:DNA primase
MRYSDGFIEKIKDGNNIVDIISQSTSLKPAGSQLTGLCPYPNHQEKTPSFSVSDQKQVYYCFGCKKSGNIFNFLQDIKGLNFVESIEYLANRASIPLPKDDLPKHVLQKQNQKAQLKKNLSKLNNFVSDFFHQELLKLSVDDPVTVYLKNRGLNREVIQHFKIGYCPDGWQALTDYLQLKKIPLPWAEEVGLIKNKNKTKSDNPHYFDIFRDRIMFPIYSHKEECVGFGGRIVNEGQPKYLNSPESSVFSKGHIFYGLSDSAKHIRTEDEVLIVEGYMDCIALYKAGFKNVVATLGTALTEHHAKLIKRYTKNVVVLFDGDQAGQNAAERSLPYLLKEGLFPKALILPDNLDPDDFINNSGAPALKTKIKAAPELFQVIFNKSLENYSGSASDKIKVVDRMAPYIHCATDIRLKNLYFEEIKERLLVKGPWLKSAIGAPQPASTHHEKPIVNHSPDEKINDFNSLESISVISASLSEIHFLNLCLMKEDLLKSAIDTQFSSHIRHEGVRKIFAKIEDHYRQFPNKFDSLTTSLMMSIKEKSLIGKQFEGELSLLNTDELNQYFKDCMDKIKQRQLKSRARNIAQNLKGKSSEEQLKELEQFMNIQNNKLEIQRN